jgi:dTDP-4-amino-4,6-dideoxygalactose transaminase
MHKNKKFIKLFDPQIGSQERNNINSVISSHVWASGGGSFFVNSFEEKFNKYVKSKSSVAVNSGTAALHLATSLLSLKGFEVIVPSLSFVSTAHAVSYAGGKIVFADVNPSTLCLDPYDVVRKLTKKTKAIIPVHFGGLSCDLDTLKNIANSNDLSIIEDAAHATGTSYKGKKIGSHGDLVCFSFHPVKNLAMPSGGLISINMKNPQNLRNTLLSRRWCGISDRKDTNYDIKELGWNFYMNEFSAAIGLAQLSKLDQMNQYRKNIAYKYYREINSENKMPFTTDCSYHFYWILTKSRNKIRKKLHDMGIETGTHYKPIHKMNYYLDNTQLPCTDKAGNEIITIPTHPNLSSSDVSYIIECINKII